MMRRKSALLVSLLTLILAFGGAVQAADLGARAMGMGGAYTALADDASAVYWNPAGLANVRWVSFTPVLAFETTGFDSLQDFMALLEFDPDEGIPEMPTEDWSLSASATGLGGIVTKRFGFSYLPSARVSASYTYDAGDLGFGEDSVLSGRYTLYNDKVVSAAFPLAKAPFNLAEFNVGANLKLVDGKYYTVEKQVWDPSDPTGSEEPATLAATGQGYGLDLGVQAQVTERLRLGAVARDVLRNVDWSGSVPDEVEVKPAYQAGVAFKAPLGLTLAADVENAYEYGKRVTRFRAGFEESLFGILALRGGVRTNPDGQKPAYSVGLGAGLFKFLRLEFAVASDLEDRLDACLTGVLQF